MEKTAFLFPGQGTLPRRLPTGSSVADRLLPLAAARGLPLRDWIGGGRADLLEETRAAQPAILVASLAEEERLRSAGVRPAIVAGHSLGEYAAAVSAGLLAPEEAFAVVLERGRLMADVRGGMLAVVKLTLPSVEAILRDVGPAVAVANVNGPAQVVVSGEVEALERVAVRVAEAGGRAIALRVSGPFHSPLMAQAQAGLAPLISALRPRLPAVPLVSSVSGRAETDPDRWKALLLTQITACVRWVDAVQALVAAGVTRAIEVGPGDVLIGLGRRITSEIEFRTVEEVLDGGV